METIERMICGDDGWTVKWMDDEDIQMNQTSASSKVQMSREGGIRAGSVELIEVSTIQAGKGRA